MAVVAVLLCLEEEEDERELDEDDERRDSEEGLRLFILLKDIKFNTLRIIRKKTSPLNNPIAISSQVADEFLNSLVNGNGFGHL